MAVPPIPGHPERRHMRAFVRWSAAALLLATSSACSKDGDDGDISPLTAPEQLSLIQADDSVLTAALVVGEMPPPGSDYFTDQASVHVFDPSMEALDTINEILCYLDMTAYDEMLNRGPYTAQTDTALCEAGEQDEEVTGSGQTSAAGASEFQLFVVDSSRSGRAAHEVDIWVPWEAEDPLGSGLIYAQMFITRGATRLDPFGQFQLSFAGVPEGGSVSDPTTIGVLGSINQPGIFGFQMYEEFGDVDATPALGDFSFRRRVAVSRDQTADSGFARVSEHLRFDIGFGDSGLLGQEWKVAFNETHFKRQLGSGPEVTLSRSDFDNTAWRYNLYHAGTGERVELDSGFPFRTAEGAWGWVGYYGVWTPEGVSVADGDVIYRELLDLGTQEEEFFVVRAPGKLIRHTREMLDIGELAGHSFHWWSGAAYLVTYEAGFFNKVAVWDDADGEWDAIEPPEVIDVAAAGGFLDLWSESLGGRVSYVAGDRFITFFEETFVNGADDLFAAEDSVALYGFFQCLDAGITGLEAEAGDVYLADAPDTETPHVYRFAKDDLTLFHDADGSGTTLTRVGLADGEEPESGPNLWGMHSGPLVLDTSELGAVLDVWTLDEFYTYETGHNEWNQYTAIKDAMGEYTTFDAPLQFLYTHSSAADLNGDATHDGRSVVLHYGGPGDLWGIPHEGRDLMDGDAEEDRWFPIFSIVAGTMVGPTGSEYIVRPTEIEQTLREDPGAAPGLDVSAADALVLPDSNLYRTPDIGPRPDVPGPPAVLNGVVRQPN